MLKGIAQGLEVAEDVLVVRLERVLLRPMVPGANEEEILRDMSLWHGGHVGERPHQCLLEGLRRHVQRTAVAMHSAVEACRSTPVLVLLLDQVEVAVRSNTTAQIPATWGMMEGSIQELRLVVVLLVEAPAHGREDVEAGEALLHRKAPPKLQHGLQLLLQKLGAEDGEDRLVVDLHVAVILEVLHQVLKVLFPVLTVAVGLRDEGPRAILTGLA